MPKCPQNLVVIMYKSQLKVVVLVPGDFIALLKRMAWFFSHAYAKNADGVDVDDDAVAKLFRNRLVKSFAIGWLKTSQLVGYNLRNRLFSQEGPCYECEIEFKSVSSSLC